jgi:ABC-type dipeptide/oligopeptide/nickel transport system ATPase component
LGPEDYESKVQAPKSQSSVPNPFEQVDLWGCDELLRRVFERLGQGRSQALIGPTGCGKSEILRTIGQQGAIQLGREQETFLYIDMHWIRDEQGFFEELSTALDCDTCDQNQMRRKLIKAKRPYVLCLDAIHVLTNEDFFPTATRNWLRGMAEMPGSPLQLVITSQSDLRKIFPDNSNQSSPLADFFAGQTEWLNHWDLGKVEAFLRDRLSGTGVEFEPGQIEMIHQNSAGKPKLVRELALDLYHRKVSGGDRL